MDLYMAGMMKLANESKIRARDPDIRRPGKEIAKPCSSRNPYTETQLVFFSASLARTMSKKVETKTKIQLRLPNTPPTRSPERWPFLEVMM